MNIFKRIRNIWKLGGIELFPNGHYQTLNPITGEPIIGKPRLAQIIKKQTAIDKFLQELKNE